MSSELRTVIDFGKNYIPYVETTFDYAGYVPIVSTISGGLRIQFGLIQAVVSLAIAAVAQLFARVTGNMELRQRSWEMLNFTAHGVVNIGRGMIECQRWINLICLISDLYARELRITYQKPIFEWSK